MYYKKTRFYPYILNLPSNILLFNILLLALINKQAIVDEAFDSIRLA
jgi:hypothetical protein